MLSKELSIGRAGEYIVLADLLLKELQCFDTCQGCTYDIIFQKNSKLFKVQVKTTLGKKKWDSKIHQKVIPSYFFHIKRAGKNGKKQYSSEDFDIYALVMLDIKKVAYLSNINIPKASITLRDKNFKYYNETKSKYYQDLTLEKAILEIERR